MQTLSAIATARGLDLEEDFTLDVSSGRSYLLATADVLLWLSSAPDISQGGQSYSFTDEQRTMLRARAKALLATYDEDTTSSGITYGYKGGRL